LSLSHDKINVAFEVLNYILLFVVVNHAQNLSKPFPSQSKLAKSFTKTDSHNEWYGKRWKDTPWRKSIGLDASLKKMWKVLFAETRFLFLQKKKLCYMLFFRPSFYRKSSACFLIFTLICQYGFDMVKVLQIASKQYIFWLSYLKMVARNEWCKKLFAFRK